MQIANYKNQVLGVCLLMMFSACRREQITSYTVPKETNSPTQTATAEAEPASPKIRWTRPSEWKELPGSEMRVGNFVVEANGKKAEITVMPFPGDVGGELANVNRWRGQAGLEPVTEAQTGGVPVSVGGQAGKLYDIGGAAGGPSIMAASVPHLGQTWFFKMMGDPGIVGAEKERFTAFVKSVSFPDSNVPPASETSVGSSHAETEHSARQAPSHWKPATTPPMLVAKYAIPGDKGNAEVTVSRFPGNVGGIAANVNRWRGQMGLDPLHPAEAEKLAVPSMFGHHEGRVVEIEGSKSARMVAVILPHSDETWFFKLSGDSSVVAREKEAFLQYVKSAE